jgi:hypothetical protein
MSVMIRLIQRQCVQSLLRRDNAKSSLKIKHLTLKLVPFREQNPWFQPVHGGFERRAVAGIWLI